MVRRLGVAISVTAYLLCAPRLIHAQSSQLLVTVTYTGSLGPVSNNRPLCLCVYTDPDLHQELGCLISSVNGAPFQFAIGDGDYYLIAFLDPNFNEKADPSEPYVIYHNRAAPPADPVTPAPVPPNTDMTFGDENLTLAATPTPTALSTPTPTATISLLCGNGVVDSGEQCDDGNTMGGDGCSAACQSELIPGGGSKKTDCTHEWLTNPVTARNTLGIPTNRLVCTDDDPLCDFGPSGDHACTFHVALCLNATEQRFACTPTDVTQVQLKAPREVQPKDANDTANRDALEAALTGINGSVRGMCANSGPQRGHLCAVNSDCDSTPGSGNGRCTGRFVSFAPPLTLTNTCTELAAILVPLRINGASGTKTLRLAATPSKDPISGRRRSSDSDVLRLVCQPKP